MPTLAWRDSPIEDSVWSAHPYRITAAAMGGVNTYRLYHLGMWLATVENLRFAKACAEAYERILRQTDAVG